MWVDRAKKDEEGHEFVRCRFVARDLNLGHDGLRDGSAHSGAPAQGDEGFLFQYIAGTRRAGSNRGDPEVKLMFVGPT